MSEREQGTSDSHNDTGAEPMSGHVQAEGIVSSIRKTLRFLVISTLLLYGGGAIFVVVTYNNSRTVNEALCNFTDDLERRVISSQDFLDDHPKGAFGFTPAEIQVQITNQQRTINSLSSLDCD